MRKFLYLAAVAIPVLTLAAPAVAAAAPAASVHVLTFGKVGGPEVKPGTVLFDHLEKGTSAVFTLGSIVIKCKSSGLDATVVKNPVAPGTATESLTSGSLGKCATGIAGATVKSIKVLNLPYDASVSDSKGFPVVITGRSKSKPIEVTSTVSLGGSAVTCTYKTTAIHASFSNKSSGTTVTSQPFTKVKGSGLCPAKAKYTALYGPKQGRRNRHNETVKCSAVRLPGDAER